MNNNKLFIEFIIILVNKKRNKLFYINLSLINYNNFNNTNSSNSIDFNNQKNSKYLHNNIHDYKTLISKLQLYSNKTKQTNIIFTDLYTSKNCYDKNSFILFEYYLNNNIDIPYYVINNESDFYKSLIRKNKTKNLILYNDKSKDFLNDIYKYLKDTKIIITSYNIYLTQLIASYVSYINFLKINHGIRYFKYFSAKIEIRDSLGIKGNVICSSPFEYKLLKKLNFKNEQIHNASLIRYERFNTLKKNNTDKKCILVSFTYRSYDRYIFEKSKYKINLEKFLNNKDLIIYLMNKNIDLIYIPHHVEISLGKNYSQSIFFYAKIKNQSDLEYFIDHCSLFITDFSSISFDFMFQNKPVLYYPIDKNEKYEFKGKKYVTKPNDTIYFGNYFDKLKLIINKIKYFANNNFVIRKELKKKYESVFFLKKDIIQKTVEIINNIIKRKKLFKNYTFSG